MGDGREGDWECLGCRNRNYAFRSFCNRCKQPRLYMDNNTSLNSKWLPRIGDWICTGCTNNNYASREKCKKCGQPKEVAALSSPLTIPGASFQAHHLNYFARGPVPTDQTGSSLALSNAVNQASALKEWRNGDWICKCGFHNYSSRIQCKKCNETAPLAIGTKRLASEVLLAHEWDIKRLNQGYTSVQPHSAIYGSFPGITNWQLPLQFLQQQQHSTPALLGKGAKQWRDGDWMCNNCKNHNYASRSECNRCKTKRDIHDQDITPTQS
ncbi:unnamed protein product [Cochlearia groenlandica]